MNLGDIQPAIDHIYSTPVVTDLRAHTYLSTYPIIIDLAAETNTDSGKQFHQLALMIYGWMPRVLRIDPEHIQAAIEQMVEARNINIANHVEIDIQPIADCLHSVVGASKLLHFINPEVFPIWDSRIQAFCGRVNTHHAMRTLGNYLQYIDDVHSIAEQQDFHDFYNDYHAANTQRLEQSNIIPYQVSAIRAIEASAFELSP